MTPVDRKSAFRHQASLDGKTLSGAAYEACGVTWDHLRGGISGDLPLSADVKRKFASYIGQSVEFVFGDEQTSSAA